MLELLLPRDQKSHHQCVMRKVNQASILWGLKQILLNLSKNKVRRKDDGVEIEENGFFFQTEIE